MNFLPLNIRFLLHTSGSRAICTSLSHWYVVGVDQRAKCAIISVICTLPHSPIVHFAPSEIVTEICQLIA